MSRSLKCSNTLSMIIGCIKGFILEWQGPNKNLELISSKIGYKWGNFRLHYQDTILSKKSLQKNWFKLRKYFICSRWWHSQTNKQIKHHSLSLSIWLTNFELSLPGDNIQLIDHWLHRNRKVMPMVSTLEWHEDFHWDLSHLSHHQKQ